MANRNPNRRYTLTELEYCQLATAFKTHGIKTPVQRYNLRYTQKLHGQYRRDPENACTKWYTDALVDCGLLADDSFEEIRQFEIRRPEVVPTSQNEETIITIEVVMP